MPKCLVKSVSSVEQLFWGEEEWGWGEEAPDSLFIVNAHFRQEVTPQLLSQLGWSGPGMGSLRLRPRPAPCLLHATS